MDSVKHTIEIRAEFGPGRYFLGDICYALNKTIYQDFWGVTHEFKDGVYSPSDRKFAVSGTAYGDGSYRGSDDIEYGVDAGVIGVVPESLWGKECKSAGAPTGGRILNIKDELIFESDGRGRFTIRADSERIVIDTKDETDE